MDGGGAEVLFLMVVGVVPGLGRGVGDGVREEEGVGGRGGGWRVRK